MASAGSLHWADFVVIGGYFLLSIAVGLWVRHFENHLDRANNPLVHGVSHTCIQIAIIRSLINTESFSMARNEPFIHRLVVLR